MQRVFFAELQHNFYYTEKEKQLKKVSGEGNSSAVSCFFKERKQNLLASFDFECHVWCVEEGEMRC